MTKRREFIKNATGFAIGTIVLPDFLMANNIFKNHNYNNFNGNNFAADNLLFGDPVIRTIGAEDIIIQAHSLTIDEVFYKGLSKNLHILCYDLRINDDIEIINGKNINITCVNLILSKNIAITSKGTLGEPAAKDLNGQSTGQNGKDGDNLIATSNGYKIFGGNAGEIKINYSKINANFKVTLISKGGDGAKGEDGGDGYRGGQGKPGSDATEDSTPSTGG